MDSRTRFVHLVDSQVCSPCIWLVVAPAVENFGGTLLRINSLLLASGAHGVWTYVHTELNPADRPSRRPVKKKWLK